MNHSYSTAIVLNVIDLALWIQFGLADLACWSISVISPFSFPKLYRKLHQLFNNMYVCTFSYKWNMVSSKMIYIHVYIHVLWRKAPNTSERRICFKYFKNFFQGIIWCLLKRTYSTDSLQVPHLGHSCDSLLLAWLQSSSNCPWVPKQNLKSNLKVISFTYFNYSQPNLLFQLGIDMQFGFML